MRITFIYFFYIPLDILAKRNVATFCIISFFLLFLFIYLFFGLLKAPEVVFHFFTLSRATARACPARGSYFLSTGGYLLITIVLSTFLRSLIL